LSPDLRAGLTPQFDEVTRCSRPSQRASAGCGGCAQRRSFECAGGVNYRLGITLRKQREE